MPNISITQRCNRSCSFCFAENTMREFGRNEAMMTRETFLELLDFLDRSQIKEVVLLGGEPTIHPEFLELVELARSRDFDILVLTGGKIPPRILDQLTADGDPGVGFMMNAISPGQGDSDERSQAKTMEALGNRLVLAHNIVSPSEDLFYLFDLIAHFDLLKEVRLGITHPTLGGENSHLPPTQYKAAGRMIASFYEEAHRREIMINFDCGFVPCMFERSFLEHYSLGPDEIGLRCSPIVDALPGGDFISCYPLAKLGKQSLAPGLDLHELSDRFHNWNSRSRLATLFPHCPGCEWYRNQQCVGGCLSASLKRASNQIQLS